MTLDPHKQRELVFLLLFSSDMGQDLTSKDVVDVIAQECKVAKKYVVDAAATAQAIVQHRDACDARIQEVCEGYTVSRLQSIERNLLRLAIYELVIEKKVPPKVIFSEAKRLAKKFGSDEAAVFVHALIAAVSVRSGLTTDEASVGDP
jgi:N utilization substance protein B